MPRRVLLAIELLLIWVGAPLAVRTDRVPVHPFVALWAAMALCLVLLLADRGYDRGELWRPGRLAGHWKPIVVRFLIVAAIMTAAVVVFLPPEQFLGFPRGAPLTWGVVMVLYPWLSVFPQGIIYRAFLMHRYGPVLPEPWGPVLLSGLAFGVMHIVFRNPLAIVLTVAGGALFAHTHRRSGSLFVSSFEHALYGCLIFTVGLGRHFYLGNVG